MSKKYKLNSKPILKTLSLKLNGKKLKKDKDYIIKGTTIIFTEVIEAIREAVQTCNCKMCKNVKEGIKDIKEGRITTHRSVDEWEKIRKIWENIHPIRHKVEQIYYSVRGFFIRIGDFFLYDIKAFIQRGKRGYADRDVWCLGFYIARILVGMLKKLKKNGHGVPTWTKKKTEKQAVKEWDDILDNIIYTFEVAMEIGDNNVDYIPTTQKDKTKIRKIYNKIRKELNIKYPELPQGKVLTEKESKRLEKGFDLFKKWFFQLWD